MKLRMEHHYEIHDKIRINWTTVTNGIFGFIYNAMVEKKEDWDQSLVNCLRVYCLGERIKYMMEAHRKEMRRLYAWMAFFMTALFYNLFNLIRNIFF